MSLGLAILHAQAVWGMDWYHRPGYYPTPDGVIPYRWFVAESQAVPAIRAAQELLIAQAVALAHADRDARAERHRHLLATMAGQPPA